MKNRGGKRGRKELIIRSINPKMAGPRGKRTSGGGKGGEPVLVQEIN